MASFATPYGLRCAAHCFNRAHAQQRGQALIPAGGKLGVTSPRLKSMNLNTVLVPVAWETIEPEEGKFDFSNVDGLLKGARDNDLRLVILWFGAWKNTYSSYVPAWVKRDQTRFARVQTSDGHGTERLSPFPPPLAMLMLSHSLD